MKIFLLTVAGLSTRFSESVGYRCLKCIYYKKSFRESLLYQMLQRHVYFDKVVVVGGFMYSELEATIKKEFSAITDKIILVRNPQFNTLGSGYSLYTGLEAIKDMDYDELVFAEGDLFIDDGSFHKVCISPKNVMTYNMNPIYADKAVAFYFNLEEKVHYIYDTSHGFLEVQEPFLSIFNSGQVWKFVNINFLKKTIAKFPIENWQETNLKLINNYFQNISKNSFELIPLQKWINCNTVYDFNKIMEV